MMTMISQDSSHSLKEIFFTLLPDEFALISQFVYERFGLALEESKLAMVQARLYTLFKERGYTGFKQFYADLHTENNSGLLTSLIDRIVTNHSFFCRESEHFSFLQQTILPEYLTAHRDLDDLRIWCAGCAQGEEAYSIAIYLAEFLQFLSWPQEPVILATDISRSCLQKAINGNYTGDKLKKMPAEFQRRYFKPLADSSYSIAAGLKKMILFRYLNLLQEPYPFKRKFDVIFCRNVMIYFDEPTRQRLMERFTGQLKNGGYLFVGASEFFGNKIAGIKFIQSAVYQKC